VSTVVNRAADRIQRFGERHPDALRLARFASLAVRVEPHLLRMLRLELLPESDVGTEADLWFSPLVESRDTTGFVLDANVAAVLREDLARAGDALRRAIAVTRLAHRNAPLTVRLEERLNALALLGGPDTVGAIDDALRPALRTLHAGGADAREIALWALRALPRLHPDARRSQNALALVLGASALVGRRRVLKEFPETAIDIDAVGWTLPPDAFADRVRVGVRLEERGLAFAEPGHGPAIELPRTTPLLVELRWIDDEPRVQLVEAVAGRAVDLDADITTVTLRTLAGDEYELRRTGTESTTTVEGARIAKVLVLGNKGSGRSALLRALSRQPFKEGATDRRALCFLGAGRSDSVVALHEVTDDERWLLQLDLDGAALVLIVENVHGGVEESARRLLQPLRFLRPDIPVVFAGTHADQLDDDAKSVSMDLEALDREDLQARGIDPEVAGHGSSIVSAQRGINIDAILSAIVRRIDWNAQPVVSAESLLSLMRTALDLLPPVITESYWRRSMGPGVLAAHATALAVRSFPEDDIVFVDPASFETMVYHVFDAARDGPFQFPARELEVVYQRVVDAAQRTIRHGEGVDWNHAVRAVVRELARIDETAVVTTEKGDVIVAPRWIEYLPTESIEGNVVLRARWRGDPLMGFATLAAMYVFSGDDFTQFTADFNPASRHGEIIAAPHGEVLLALSVDAEDDQSVLRAEQIPRDLDSERALRQAVDLLTSRLNLLSGQHLMRELRIESQFETRAQQRQSPSQQREPPAQQRVSSEQRTERRTFLVKGQVQGVFFRTWVRNQARALGLDASATNLADGDVRVEAEGPADVVEQLHGLLHQGPQGAQVTDVIELPPDDGPASQSRRP
jgi:acylphosphatase